MHPVIAEDSEAGEQCYGYESGNTSTCNTSTCNTKNDLIKRNLIKIKAFINTKIQKQRTHEINTVTANNSDRNHNTM